MSPTQTYTYTLTQESLPMVPSPEKKDEQEVDKLGPTKDNAKILQLIDTINERLSEKYSLISAAINCKDDSAIAKYQAKVKELEDAKSRLEAALGMDSIVVSVSMY